MCVGERKKRDDIISEITLLFELLNSFSFRDSPFLCMLKLLIGISNRYEKGRKSERGETEREKVP